MYRFWRRTRHVCLLCILCRRRALSTYNVYNIGATYEVESLSVGVDRVVIQVGVVRVLHVARDAPVVTAEIDTVHVAVQIGICNKDK